MKGMQRKRLFAGGLTLWLLVGMVLPTGAAALQQTTDETYYATLDYYGGLLDSSVVKSIRTFGNATVTDYGSYEEVTNLTDDREAQLSGGKVTFDLTGSVPNKFYFEGKTTKPYDDFPWALSLSYTLNGLPAKAEDLAGEQGVVEITLDAVPNAAASEYSRNNLVLTAMSLFNGDDILSLEAPGAQVQLVGNLYCVLYMVMPGEEQHFTIRVGSDDFTYSGMIFLAVPATLDQLSQIADLKEAKETGEDSYHAIQDSMDVILDSLDGMSDNLAATAAGLDKLNQSRDTISKGKGEVYDSLDAALDSSALLTDSLQPINDHLTSAQQALTDTTALLNEVSANVVALQPEVENTRQVIAALKTDTANLKSLLGDVEGYNKRASSALTNLADGLNDMADDLSTLESRLNTLKGALNKTSGVNNLTTDEILGSTYVDVGGEQMTAAALVTALNNTKQLYEAYAAYAEQMKQAGDTPVGINDFLVNYFESEQSMTAEQAQANATKIQTLYAFTTDPQYAEQYSELQTSLKSASGEVGMANDKIDEINTVITNLTKPTANVVDSLADLCETLGDEGLVDDMTNLIGVCKNLLKTLKTHEGEGAALLEDVDEVGDLITRITANLDTALAQTQSLTDVMDQYEPGTQQALEDAKTVSDSLTSTITSITAAVKSGEALLQKSGSTLDAGTKQTLSGLSSALRRSTQGLSQTDVIRTAKDTIDALITDQWDSHAGGENNILLMDAAAAPESLTDARNQGVTSIQYVMRSQEIKVSDEDTTSSAQASAADEGTLWTRILDMFRDIWQTFTGWFKR